jgi:membrane-bound lytic murein transglycosylase D
MKKILSGIIIGFAIVGILSLFIFSRNQGANQFTDTKNDSVCNTFMVNSYPLPDSITFAGEQVPLQNFDVRESLDKEIHKIAYWHSETLLYLKRANRYFPVIEKILKANNIHDDFKYMAVAESGLTNTISPAGATGFWQILKATGQSYGLEINNEVDERYHIEKSTVVACKYLKDAYRKYKNWSLAAASYNAGMGNIDKFIKIQKANSYYDLVLTEETARYVYRIIAFKLIMTHPRDYGFNIKKEDLYPMIPVHEVTLDSSVKNFSDYAARCETNYKMLKYFNPWLRDTLLTNKTKKTYSIILPDKNSRATLYNK